MNLSPLLSLGCDSSFIKGSSLAWSALSVLYFKQGYDILSTIASNSIIGITWCIASDVLIQQPVLPTRLNCFGVCSVDWFLFSCKRCWSHGDVGRQILQITKPLFTYLSGVNTILPPNITIRSSFLTKQVIQVRVFQVLMASLMVYWK